MHIQIDDLCDYLNRDHYVKRNVIDVAQLRGGAQKVVYRVSCDDDFTCVLYVWDDSANYVLGEALGQGPGADALGASYGAELFAYNQRYLENLGVRVPRIFYMDRSKAKYPFEFALVEDLGNLDLPQYIRCHPETSKNVLEQLSDTVRKMHFHQYNRYGQLNTIDTNHERQPPCEQIILNETMLDLDYLAMHVPEIAENKEQLAEVLRTLYDAIAPRTEYGLIHGELGPDHVRIDQNGQPVLIDIEGAKFFDIEYEHSFLDFRFGDNYRYLRFDHLDSDRLRFYRLHLHMSYSSGPLQIIERGFPDPAVMREIARFNVESTLNFLK